MGILDRLEKWPDCECWSKVYCTDGG